MARKNVGLRYGEFEFPSEQGFTGSAGRSEVKGYMRGGKVKGRNKPNKASKRAKGTTKAAHGGFMGPEREITVDDVTISTPRKRGGKVSTHDKLVAHGKKLGYAYGGRVKDTSGEFKAKRGPQKTMDHGNQPARRGRTQAEIEAGGTKRLKPGLQAGGLVTAAHAIKKVGGSKQVRKGGKAAMKRLRRSPDKTKGKGSSKKGMPKNVKAKGGKVRKPYTGYNQQPGGSGVEDSRYMMTKRGAARSR